MKNSDFCYTCIFDEEFNIIWTDNHALFKHITRRHKKLKKMVLEANATDTIYHTLTFNDESYSLKIDMLLDRRVICRAMKELPPILLNSDELKAQLETIANRSMDVFRESLKLSKSKSESASDAFQEDAANRMSIMAAAISSGCMNILHFFENESEKSFVPIEKYLVRVFERLNYSLRKNHKEISYCFDGEEPYWKIDCKNFEQALFNIVKMIIVLTAFGNSGTIIIRSVQGSSLHISTSFPYEQNYSQDSCHWEIQVLKHIFEIMGGKIDVNISEEERTVVFDGYVEAESSYNESDVDEMFRLCLDESASTLNERRKDKELTLTEFYSRKKKDKNHFGSPMLNLNGDSDNDLELWTLIFESTEYLKNHQM